MPSKLRVGVVGANIHEGWGGRVHVPVYQALAETEVVAICNSRLETAQEACQHFGIPRAFNDYNQLVQSPEIDAVSISTRVSLHHPIALAALSAGKHVFCEWPLAVTSGQASELLALAQANRLQHGIDAQARGAPALLRMRELVEEGYLGRLLTFNMKIVQSSAMVPREQHHWWIYNQGEGGDALTIPCGHAVDFMQWCLGDIAEVAGASATQVEEGSIAESGEQIHVTSFDTVAFAARLDNGAVGSVYTTWASLQDIGWQLEAYGTEGSLVASAAGGLQVTPVQLRGARRGEGDLRLLEVPDHLKEVTEFSESDPRYNVAVLARRFASAALGQGKPNPDFADAVRLHRVLEAVVASSEGRRWEAVPLA